MIIFLLYCIFSINVLHRSYVNIFGYTYFTVGSGSMSPSILSNDIVIVNISNKYDVNDIVTFKYNEEFITHRIIEISNDKIITKGDANYIVDNPIHKDDIIGKVVLIWPRGGIIKKVLLTPRVVVMIIITLVLFMITYSYDTYLFKKFRMRRLSHEKIIVFKREIRERNRKERERKLKRNIKNKKTKEKKRR